MIRFVLMLTTAFAACSPNAAPPAPAAPPPEAASPTTLKELEQAHDWQHGPGASLNAAFDTGAQALLGSMSRSDAIDAIQAAGFDCTYGEAHEDYPDPMAVCTRSFATRSCQMDWEIASTANKGMVDEVDATFERDCVGTDDDWPDKVVSDIDKQLAPVETPH